MSAVLFSSPPLTASAVTEVVNGGELSDAPAYGHLRMLLIKSGTDATQNNFFCSFCGGVFFF